MPWKHIGELFQCFRSCSLIIPFRDLGNRVVSADEKNDLRSRVETGIDICSIDYYNGLWEDAAEVKGFASGESDISECFVLG